MNDGFRVDPAALARHAERFPEFARRADTAHQELRDALDAAGECWGSDATGRGFADSHVTSASETARRLGSLPGRLSGVGDRFAATARGYQQTEEDNVRAVAAVYQQRG